MPEGAELVRPDPDLLDLVEGDASGQVDEGSEENASS
jgi:hypothetical protein